MVISPVQVKICCIRSPEEAEAALSFGAAALGLVSEMPGGPGELPEETIREIVDSLPPSVLPAAFGGHLSPDCRHRR